LLAESVPEAEHAQGQHERRIRGNVTVAEALGRIPTRDAATVFHSHSAQWEFSNKWVVRSPERHILRSDSAESVDYWDGEE
jgi:hypothetical protein